MIFSIITLTLKALKHENTICEQKDRGRPGWIDERMGMEWENLINFFLDFTHRSNWNLVC